MRNKYGKNELIDRTQAAGRAALLAGREVWLASLGTALVVGEESRKMFDRLVREGRRMQRRQAARVTDRVEQFGEKVRTVGDQVQAGVHDAMAATLHRFDVPTHDDIQALLSRVEQLSAKVRTLNAR